MSAELAGRRRTLTSLWWCLELARAILNPIEYYRAAFDLPCTLIFVSATGGAEPIGEPKLSSCRTLM